MVPIAWKRAGFDCCTWVDSESGWEEGDDATTSRPWRLVGSTVSEFFFGAMGMGSDGEVGTMTVLL